MKNQESLNSRIKGLISQMSLQEKIAFMPSRHPSIERLNLPGFHIGGEGAHGLVHRDGGLATVFPQPFGLSMTWNKALMKKIGGIIGDEARVHFGKSGRKGFLCLFFPTIDMERDPRWGRNEEAYGEDPFLAGKLAVELIKGAQGEHEYYLKIATSPKHFYANNYELERTTADSVITDERLKHEYYLRVFAYAFEEGRAASLMAAYNKMNGIPGMLHPEMNGIVRDKWYADGFFVSDGGAFKLVQTEHKARETFAESAAAAVKAGLDCFLDDPELVIKSVGEAVERGLLTEPEIDAALFNQFKILFRLGVYGENEGNPYECIPESALCSDKNSAIAVQAALESVTLLKNDGILPLNPVKTKKIAVIGLLGNENMPDWYSGNPPYQVTPLDGIKKAFPHSEAVYSDGCDTAAFYSEPCGKWLRVSGDGAVHLDGDEDTRSAFKVLDWGFGGFGFRHIETRKYLTTTPAGELRCDAGDMWGWFVRELFFLENSRFITEKAHGTLSQIGVAMRKGTSVYDKPYENGGVDKINDILGKLTLKVITDGLAESAETAKGADAAVVVLGNHTLVGARECIDRENLDLPARWAQLFDKVAYANKNAVLALIAGYPFAIEQQAETARAVIFTTHGAQEVGTAVGETLSGGNNPAGRLSMTWYKADEVLPDLNDYDIVKNKMTYLYCDRPAQYAFGFGLSYTSFKYADLELTKAKDGINVSFSVTNTGELDGDEVAQVYFSHSDALFTRPIKQLAGFERIHFKAGETKRLSIYVPHKELEYYDIEKGAFGFIPGEYKFMAGASSDDIRLSVNSVI
ncbi:MAG: glycoside hydrolase family 3 C-terminal domain-containing protein [Defluviitaleaceae bacterium]|nr:glycoside hydrolase family 3 C-terminal domain-containing protein [Defluviitaleaceae bacterium]MCL2836704.1 glycoside hydrolase family 3 C-terminal domain-containing protein [Defluviitaleaceae bacterium]